MHSGKIKKVVRDRGFGFIVDTDGRELFFHRNSLAGTNFDALTDGQLVEFEVQKSPKGLSAVNVKVTASGNIFE
ncbi:MAG: cold-shock protein [Candidatus Omnitrophica bacterium CG11_big_fil_rev_8_21_14_0_20_42_13]|uniref:Cold-shock protein n=1 Tax=Candidatus Ghiorseimicrobium undicola TaxID=1974746 RepID=A0A2H0LZ90_9BACT|nr:MAG: cold-shock protein [Candidatus Omnitrophica bacterium CG11_big_fil_rev_8_21_14_0_20_42_13]